jgi:hypothetical protein
MVSRAARGHLRGGLAHTQSEVRIGAKQHIVLIADVLDGRGGVRVCGCGAM